MGKFTEGQRNALGLEVAPILEPFWDRPVTDEEIAQLQQQLEPIGERYEVTIEVSRHVDQKLAVTANPHDAPKSLASIYYFPPIKRA